MKDTDFPVDAFELQELLSRYRAASYEGKIQLLTELMETRVSYKIYNDKYQEEVVKEPRLPFEIALLAIDDPNAEVRRWFARHGKLNFCYSVEDGEINLKFPDRNLETRLRNDPEPVVRASLYLNEDVFPSWESEWSKATHIERLALVRKPNVSGTLIRKVFDPNDEEMAVTFEERKELALAFLSERTDAERVRLLRRSFSRVEIEAQQPMGYADELVESELWRLALKWPEKSGLQDLIFRYVGARSKTVAEIYRASPKPEWKRTMLRWGDSRATYRWDYFYFDKAFPDIRTILELGMNDGDGECRSIAYERANFRHEWLAPKALREALRSKDVFTLIGLARNKSVGERKLKIVLKRLSTLKADATSKLHYPDYIEAIKTAEKLIEECSAERLRFPAVREEEAAAVAAWTLEQKINYLGQLSLILLITSTIVLLTGLSGGVGLLAGALAYLLSGSVALATFSLIAITWIGGAAAYRWCTRRLLPLPPWISFKKWKAQFSASDT